MRLPFDRDAVAGLLERAVDLTDGCRSSLDEVLADLSKHDLAEGTGVIIAMSNGRRFLQHYFAVLLSGGVPLAVSPATTSARILQIAEQLGVGMVISARLDPERYGVADVVSVGDAEAVFLPGLQAPRHEPGHVLMLTSGTSGIFSACVHRVDSLTRNASRHAAAVGLSSSDTVLVNLPLYYSYAIVAQAMAALVTGARLVISGPPFSPAAYLDALDRHEVTSSSITPTIARLLLTQEHRLPATLRMLTVGGDRLAPEHVGGLLEAHRGGELYLTYGLTEAGPRVSTLAAHAEPAAKYASVGLPLEGVTATLRSISPGEDELLIASDTVLVAKLGSAEAASRTLIGPGLIATGDRFRIDGEGYLYFEGRLSDFVVVRGEKVSLAAVRQFVHTLPGVVRCTTTVGTDDAGDTLFDLDVQVSGEEQGVTQIRRQIGSFLMSWERPRDIRVSQADLSTFQK